MNKNTFSQHKLTRFACNQIKAHMTAQIRSTEFCSHPIFFFTYLQGIYWRYKAKCYKYRKYIL